VTLVEPNESSELVSTVRRRTAAAAALTAVAALTLSACGTSFGAQTSQQYQASIGADVRTGPVQMLNTLLVANEDGSATLSTSLLNQSGGQRTIDSVEVTNTDGEQLPVESLKAKVTLPDNVLVPIGKSSDAGGFVVTEGAEPGRYVTVTVTFTSGAPVSIEAPVVARSEMYDDVSTGNTDDADDADDA
jgi:hypothetical protein